MEPSTPAWGLMVAYWLHMLATVIWLGGLAALALIVLPAARSTLPGSTYSAFLGRVEMRLQSIGWFSLGVLTVTGMFQMSGSPNYEGFLAITSLWAGALLAKHLAIGLMVLLGIFVTWGVTPQLRRLALLEAAGKAIDETERARLQQRQERLLQLNLVVSVIVLALTAIARAA